MRTAMILAAFLVTSTPALADDWVPPITDNLVQKECGSCHMAFQPAFLPVRSWERIMDGLADHFGEDATLPADQTAAIRTYLTENAGDVKQRGLARKYLRWVEPGAAPLKITENPAFLREHDFPNQVWMDPKVVTKSNCLACHVQADQGNFDDD